MDDGSGKKTREEKKEAETETFAWFCWNKEREKITAGV